MKEENKLTKPSALPFYTPLKYALASDVKEFLQNNFTDFTGVIDLHQPD